MDDPWEGLLLRIVTTLLDVAALLLVAVGFWLAWPPLGLIAAGCGVGFVSWQLAGDRR